jgi:radical SAM protein with 4Fe4S-binding SPASM domain
MDLEFTFSVSPCFGCRFCPQNKLAAAYKADKRRFSMEDFQLILRKLPKAVSIHASGFSEPFLNPLAPKMIALAKIHGFTVHLYTTLMGLTNFTAVALPKSIDFCCLHAPDTTGLLLNEDFWIQQHVLWRSLGIPYIVMAMGRLSEKVKRHMDSLGIDVRTPSMLSRGGNLWNVKQFTGHVVCSMNRWHSNVVLPSGDVYGCCMDWSLTVHLGNLFTQTYSDIYESAEAWKNSFKDQNSICASCEWNVGLSH